jgi:hypothetical protein
VNEDEIFDDIAARISALEFMVRQVLSTLLRSGLLRGESRAPLESALALQMAAAQRLRENLDGMEEGDDKKRMRLLNTHAARIYEDLIRTFEEDESSG